MDVGVCRDSGGEPLPSHYEDCPSCPGGQRWIECADVTEPAPKDPKDPKANPNYDPTTTTGGYGAPGSHSSPGGGTPPKSEKPGGTPFWKKLLDPFGLFLKGQQQKQQASNNNFSIPSLSSFLSSLGVQEEGMPSYDVGTSYVPHTGPAMVHEGEQIIPAGQNLYGQVVDRPPTLEGQGKPFSGFGANFAPKGMGMPPGPFSTEGPPPPQGQFSPQSQGRSPYPWRNRVGNRGFQGGLSQVGTAYGFGNSSINPGTSFNSYGGGFRPSGGPSPVSSELMPPTWKPDSSAQQNPLFSMLGSGVRY